MPEAAMHENDFSSPEKYKIWSTWEGSAVQAVPVSHAMDKFPDRHFRTGMFPPNEGHPLAAGGFAERVSHFGSNRITLILSSAIPGARAGEA